MKSRKVNNFNVGNYYKVTLEDSELYERVIKITESYDGIGTRAYQTVFGKSIVKGHFHFDSTFAEYLVPCTHKLVVLQDGNKTITKHYVDGKLLEEENVWIHIVDGNLMYRQYAPEEGSEVFEWKNSFD